MFCCKHTTAFFLDKIHHLARHLCKRPFSSIIESLAICYLFILQVVLTTLLVACSASFVLNAYNFLFLKRFAIYVWFAIAPLIWVVCPLTGAAWVTKTYVRYKLVVVNAWVDIPEV